MICPFVHILHAVHLWTLQPDLWAMLNSDTLGSHSSPEGVNLPPLALPFGLVRVERLLLLFHLGVGAL
jgi:hypothetical protein